MTYGSQEAPPVIVDAVQGKDRRPDVNEVEPLDPARRLPRSALHREHTGPVVVSAVGPDVVLERVHAAAPHRADGTPLEVPEVHEQIRRHTANLRVDVLRLVDLRPQLPPVRPPHRLELRDPLVAYGLVARRPDH